MISYHVRVVSAVVVLAALGWVRAAESDAPVFLRPPEVSHGAARITLSDPLERILTLQASGNFQDWTTLTNSRATGGILEILDREAGAWPVRHYRAFTRETSALLSPTIEFAGTCLVAGENDGTAHVTVRRLGNPAPAVQADYVMTNVTAIAGSDYTGVAGTVSFGPGVVEATIPVPILDDAEIEGDEFAALLLMNPSSGARLGDVPATLVSISDDEKSTETLASCVPFVPETLPGRLASSVAVIGSEVYYSQSGEFPLAQTLGPHGHPSPLVPRMEQPAEMVLRDQQLIWMDLQGGFGPSGCSGFDTTRTLYRTDLNTGETRLLGQADGCRGGPLDLVVDRTHVYFVGSLTSPPRYRLHRVSLDGGEVRTLHETTIEMMALTGDATHLYWAESQFPDPSGQGGVILRMAKAGGPVETLVTGLDEVHPTMAIREREVLFSDGLFITHRILSAPVTGGTSNVLATVSRAPRKLTYDGESVLWIDPFALHRVPLQGGAVDTVSTNWVSLQDVVVQQGQAYLTDHSQCDGQPRKGRVARVDLRNDVPQVLADCVDIPTRLNVHGDDVFWISSGAESTISGLNGIFAVPRNGGERRTILIGCSSDMPPMVADDTALYFADKQQLKKWSLAGGPVEILVSANSTIPYLTTDGTNVYWMEGPLTTVMKTPVDQDKRATLAVGFGPAGPIAVHGRHVYWIDRFTTINRVSIDGGEAELLAEGLPILSDLVADETHVYFSEQDTGRIRKVPVTGGLPEFLAQGQSFSWNLLDHDDTHLYWVNQNEVSRVPKGGGAVEDLDTELSSIVTIPNDLRITNGRATWTEVRSRTVRAVDY